MGIFSWFRKERVAGNANPNSVFASQKPGERFRWPKGVAVTAIDKVVLAVPLGLLEPNEPIGEFIFAPEDMQIKIADAEKLLFLNLEVGMSVHLAKTVECLVCGEDRKPRQIHLKKVETEA